MKFQNSSIHGFKVMLCIKKRDERTDGRTEGWTDGRTNNPEAICPSNFFEVGGIKRTCLDQTAVLGPIYFFLKTGLDISQTMEFWTIYMNCQS